LAAAVVAAMAVSTSCQNGNGVHAGGGGAIPGLTADNMGVEGNGLRMAPLPESGMAELEARVETLEGSLSSMVAGANSSNNKSNSSGGDDGAGGAKSSASNVHIGDGARALGERVARLEHSLGELRVTLTRRLEALDREAEETRRNAEEARAEAKTLRLEMLDLTHRLETEPPKPSPQQTLSYVPTGHTPSSAATTAATAATATATLPTVSAPMPMMTAAAASGGVPNAGRMSLGGGVGGAAATAPAMISPQPSHTAPPTPTPTVPTGMAHTVRPPPPFPQQAGARMQQQGAVRHQGLVAQPRLQPNGVVCP